jgi:hypothetical protein
MSGVTDENNVSFDPRREGIEFQKRPNSDISGLGEFDRITVSLVEASKCFQ